MHTQTEFETDDMPTDSSLENFARAALTESQCRYLDTQFDVSWAAKAAKLSEIAYEYKERVITRSLQSLGLETNYEDMGGTRGFITYVQHKNTAVVVFKGTDSFGDILTDLSVLTAKLCDDRNEIHYCHAGFVNLLNENYNKILQNLQRAKGHLVVVTGHSLGGALANILAYRLRLEPQFRGTSLHTYTFGCPIVGDNGFAFRGATRSSHNIIFDNDPVSTTCDPIPSGTYERPTGKLIVPCPVHKIGNAPSQVLSRKLPVTYEDETAEAEGGKFSSHAISKYVKVLQGCAESG